MTAVLVPGAFDAQPRPRARVVRRLVVLGAAQLLLLGAIAGGLALLLFGMVVVGATSVLLWRHPAWGAVAMIALLPVNRFVILLTFHFTGSPMLTLGAQLWKDLFVVVLLLRSIHELLLGQRPRLRWLDLLMLGFLALTALYLLYPGSGHLHVTVLNRLVGFRADALFLFMYFVGRVIPFDRRQLRWLLTALVPGAVVVGIIAAGQFLWPAWFSARLTSLGFQQFIAGQGAVGDVDIIRARSIDGVSLPRASSLLLSDLALAFFAVVVVAVAAAMYFTATTALRTVGSGAVVLLGIATTVFTVTRSAVLASLLVVVVAAVLVGRPRRALVLVVLVTLGALFVITSNTVTIDELRALSNPSEASAQGHLDAIDRGLKAVGDQPLGRGLGTAGTIGQRFVGDRALTTENWFLQIAAEIGLAGGILFILISVAAAASAAAAARAVRVAELRRIAVAVAAGSAGMFVMANVLHAWEVPILSMVFWLLVGVATGAPDRDAALRDAAGRDLARRDTAPWSAR